MQHCPLCNSPKATELFTARDWLITNEKFSICHCLICGHVYTGNPPAEAEIPKYYASENYTSHTDKASQGAIYRIAKNFNLWWKLRLIRKHINLEVRVLDYGCGTGDFLAYCQSQGNMIAYGYDPSETALKQLRSKYDFSILQNMSDISKQSFDLITLWHVIEHIPQPQNVLADLIQSINPGGILILAMPNHSSLDAKFYKEDWAAYDVPRHLHHFSPKLIVSTLTSLGLELKQEALLPFDPFYISLLSERNKSSRIPLLLRLPRALIISLISTIQSVINPSSASSPVLIFYKK